MTSLFENYMAFRCDWKWSLYCRCLQLPYCCCTSRTAMYSLIKLNLCHMLSFQVSMSAVELAMQLLAQTNQSQPLPTPVTLRGPFTLSNVTPQPFTVSSPPTQIALQQERQQQAVTPAIHIGVNSADSNMQALPLHFPAYNSQFIQTGSSEQLVHPHSQPVILQSDASVTAVSMPPPLIVNAPSVQPQPSVPTGFQSLQVWFIQWSHYVRKQYFRFILYDYSFYKCLWAA